MQLINLDISPDLRTSGSILVSGDYGGQRVQALVARADIDDYLRKDWPPLDDSQRRIFVEDNAEFFRDTIQKKCAAGEWRDEPALGGAAFKRVLISRDDLFSAVPRLSDARLRVFTGACFQKKNV